jgi:hypothetical protein
MSKPLIYWYQDNTSNSYYYTVYASQETIDKIGYTPSYFEDAKRFSDEGTILVLVFNKEKVIFYDAYIYTSPYDTYWKNKIKLSEKIKYNERQTIKFNIDDINNIQVFL